MRSRRPDPAQEEAVARRLALLTEEMALARGEPAAGGEWWADHTRVAAPRPELALVPPLDPTVHVPSPGHTESSSAAELPVPGRHARRRTVAEAGGVRWPASVAGLASRFHPGHLAVVALLVCAALAYTTWRVVHDDAEAPVPVSAPIAGEPLAPEAPVETTGTTTGPADAEPAQASGTVTVHVAGRVRRPGIVVLKDGARVIDALKRAGGAKQGVNLSSLNLARVLVDGEQILVGVRGAPAAATGPGPAPADGAPPALVDLNLADQTELETLPGVGPVTAAAILAWRAEHGGFSAITELLEVDGIGPTTLERLTPLVTL